MSTLKPLRPPAYEELLVELQPDRFFELLRMPSVQIATAEYLHWDKLFHMTPPEGFTSKEWWLNIKIGRNPLYKPIPLRDKQGTAFKFLITDSMQEGLFRIDSCATGRIGLADNILTPENRNQFYISSLIEEAITSSQLEGATTTRQVAKEMIRESRPPKDRSEQMILNNYRTMQRIREIKDQSLSKGLILQLHSIMTADALEDPTARGRFRLPEEEIRVEDATGEVYHIPPPSSELEQRISDMCDFANGKSPDYFIHPVLRSIMLHFWLAYDHPFVDGNGRTARALFYWSMLHYDFWVCEYLSISQIIRKAPAQYSRSYLYTESDDNDLTYFIVHQMDVLKRALEAMNKYVHDKAEEYRLVEEELRSRAYLNHRQRAVISHALRHPGAAYNAKGHMTSHGVSLNTAKSDLDGLAKLELLKKQGRPTYYIAPADLNLRLKKVNAES
jgi:Fic family protein